MPFATVIEKLVKDHFIREVQACEIPFHRESPVFKVVATQAEQASHCHTKEWKGSSQRFPNRRDQAGHFCVDKCLLHA